jgi:hypothetical protein
MTTCRPERLTCRWVKEITESISNVCPSIRRVQKCKDANKEWSRFTSELNKSPCSNHPTVTKILKFEIDYNEYRIKQ